MSAKNDGGPAFPFSPDGPNYCKYSGLSMRDYFAAHTDVPWNAVLDTISLKNPERGGKFTLEELARCRAQIKYREADAMLASRERKEDAK